MELVRQSEYRCCEHNPIVSSILCSTNTPRHEAHDDSEKTDGNRNNVCNQYGNPFAVVDMCQLVLGLIGRKTVVEGPVDGSLRSHIQSLESFVEVWNNRG